MNALSDPPEKQPSNIIRVDVSTQASSRVPPDFPQEVLQAMPEWREMFVHRAQFLAILGEPLTETATSIRVIQVFSTYPEGIGDWGESSTTILARGDTARAKLEDFMNRIRQVYGPDCKVRFDAGQK